MVNVLEKIAVICVVMITALGGFAVYLAKKIFTPKKALTRKVVLGKNKYQNKATKQFVTVILIDNDVVYFKTGNNSEELTAPIEEFLRSFSRN